MKVNKETLWHFSCEYCNLWWSFASSDNFVPTGEAFCPHCGKKNYIEAADTQSD